MSSRKHLQHVVEYLCLINLVGTSADLVSCRVGIADTVVDSKSRKGGDPPSRLELARMNLVLARFARSTQSDTFSGAVS